MSGNQIYRKDTRIEMDNERMKETVLVTGFAPFGSHTTNASWEAVKELKRIGLGDKYDLVIHELDVVYEKVDSVVPELWRKYNPKLVVHCGVSGIATEVTLEQRGYRSGYRTKDETGKIPFNHACNCSDKNYILSGLRMDEVCNAVNSKPDCGVTAVVSHDAGRFLCDYTYYSSLAIDCNSTAFIHVPQINKPYSVKQLAEAIKVSILDMLRQRDNQKRS